MAVLSKIPAEAKIIKMFERRGKNIYDLQKELNIPYTAIYTIAEIEERGHRGVNYKRVLQICKYLDCDPEDILEDEEAIQLTREVFGKKRK